MAKRLPAAMKPVGLGPRGALVWARYAPTDGTDIGRALLAAEVARLTDRSDQLHAIISGDVDVWAKIRLPKNESEMTLVITNPVAEARQTANVIRQITAKLDAADAESSGPGPHKQSVVPESAAEAGRSAIDAIVASHADGRPDPGTS
ncbi:hypothetical protein ACT89R_01735 [Rhodococcus qingshengii]